jgi:single-stranded-DNA-specific exonuclease
MAAGVTLALEKIDLFRARLNELARQTLQPAQLRPSLKIDAEVELTELTAARIEELGRLDPVGQGNAAVRLSVGNLSHHQPPQRMGKENQHVKFRVTNGKEVLEAVWWNGGHAPWPGEKFDLAVTAGINEFKGRRTVQLKVLDWRQSA